MAILLLAAMDWHKTKRNHYKI